MKPSVRNPSTHLVHEIETEEQKAQQAGDRRRMALVLLTNAQDAVDLALLAQALGVEAELDEIIGTSVERQRSMTGARAQLPALVAELSGLDELSG